LQDDRENQVFGSIRDQPIRRRRPHRLENDGKTSQPAVDVLRPSLRRQNKVLRPEHDANDDHRDLDKRSSPKRHDDSNVVDQPARVDESRNPGRVLKTSHDRRQRQRKIGHR